MSECFTPLYKNIKGLESYEIKTRTVITKHFHGEDDKGYQRGSKIIIKTLG